MTEGMPLFALSEEHQAIREAVRGRVRRQGRAVRRRGGREGRVPAGRRTTRSPQADFHAPHVPEEYGGAGADALATVHRDRGGRPGLHVLAA